MKKLVLLILLFCSPAFAATYYLRPDGTNADSDCSGSSACCAGAMDVSDHNAASFSANDIIYVCNDDVYSADVLRFIMPSSGSLGNPITYTGDPSNKPVLGGPTDVTDAPLSWANTGDWTDNADNTWTIALTARPIRRLWVDGTEWLSADALGNVDADNPWWQVAGGGDLTVYTGGAGEPNNPATLYTTFTGLGGQQSMIYMNNKEYITIENLNVRSGNYYGAIQVYASNNIIIQNCDIGNYGFYGVYVYGNSGGDDESHHVTIQNNNIDALWALSYDYVPGTYGAFEGILFSNGVYSSIIKNNIIKDFGHAGINLAWTIADPGGGYVGNNLNVIESNDISAPNHAYGRGFSIYGITNMSNDNIVRFNTFHDLTIQNQIGGEDNIIHNNIFKNYTDGGVAGEGDKTGPLSLSVVAGAGQVNDGTKIYNNTVSSTDGFCLRIVDNDLPNGVVNAEFTNNICENTGTGNSNIAIYVENDADITGITYTNNDIYSSATTTTIDYRGTTSTVAAWSATGTDSQSSNITGDPIFVNAAGGNFRLKHSSPAIDAGVKVATQVDGWSSFYNDKRLCGAGADIGADEYCEDSEISIFRVDQTSSKTSDWYAP